ncbi:MAG TPA: secretin N-terminal domain-containing protein [Rubrivivax sp.]|nr:secretin N-terminal domain-containing protein [Rubrivivax sp.]
MPVRLLLSAAMLAVVAGCSGIQPAPVPPPLAPPMRAPGTSGAAAADSGAQQSEFERMPAPPAAEPPARGKTAQAASPFMPERPGGFHLNFNQVPLTTLVQVVYADMLGRTVQFDPKVAERRDLVSFRTPPGQTAAQVESAMQLLLRSFGIVALDFGAMVRVVPDGAQSGAMPELRRGAAQPETPERMRPVFQLVDLEAVRNTEVAGWMKTIFGNRVTVAEDATRNALMLSGTSDNVAAAIETIRLLDQPVMRGRSSLRISPVYWSAPELASTLQQVLTAEGYSMPPPNQPLQSGGVRYPIMLLPVPATNSLLVFSVSDEVLRHIKSWVDRLDQPNKQTAGKNFFTYTPRNVSADSLARTLGQVMQGGTGGASAGGAAGGTPAAGAALAPAAANTAAAAASGSSRLVVDSNTNTLIFNTNADNYSQLISLLTTLDQPSKSALIEVTVAEVRLTDDFSFGIEWLLRDSGANSSTTVGTLGGLGLGTAGLTLTRLASAGDVRLVLNALATSDRATILSSPRVVARNGETARIQVGQEVPIVTSQQSTISSSTDNGTGVLQSIQYRNTGVILNIKPSIFSGDRIDLDVKQEVSAAQSTTTGVNNSPTFLTRNVDTKLTLQHGSTVLLGGLIADDRSTGDSGVPWLMRLPLIGQLFRVDNSKGARTELVVLITPYVVNDDSDARHYTEAFKTMLPLLQPQLAPGAQPALPPLIPPAGPPWWPTPAPKLDAPPSTPP